MMLAFLLLLTSSLAQAECASSATELSDQAGLVLQAYLAMDDHEYERAMLALHHHIDCLVDPVTPTLVRDVHLVMALERFLVGDEGGALGGLRAVLDIEPDYRVPEELAPRGHPFRALLDQARGQEPNPRQRFLRPIEGVFYMDAQPLGERPQEQPAIVQWSSIEREVCWTGYLGPGVGLPIDIVTAATEPGALGSCIAERGTTAPPPAPPAVATPAPPEPAASPEVWDMDLGEPLALNLGEPPEGTESTPPEPLDLAVAPPEPVDAGTVPLERSDLLRPLPLATAGGAVVSSGLLVASLLSRRALLTQTDACAVQRECNVDPAAALERLGVLEDRTRTLGYATQISAGVTAGLGIATGVGLVVRFSY
jgi:hypothetical protein